MHTHKYTHYLASPIELHEIQPPSAFSRKELRPGVLQQSPKGAMGKEEKSLQSVEMWHCGMVVATMKIFVLDHILYTFYSLFMHVIYSHLVKYKLCYTRLYHVYMQMMLTKSKMTVSQIIVT